MNLNMIRPKNETDFLLAITKKCEILSRQTNRKSEKTLEFELTKPKEIFHFNPPISIEGPWVIGLTSLEVYNSIFIITERNNRFELHTHTFDNFSFEEIGDELGETLAFQILHQIIYNVKKKDRVLLKHIRN